MQGGQIMETPTILWPTDLSETSLMAQNYVENLAKERQAKVILFYVGFEMETMFGQSIDKTGQDLAQEVTKWELEQARKNLQKLCDQKLKGCPYLEVKTAVGDPTQEILRAIQKEDVDLVVMPTKGRSRNSRKENYIGKVAEGVIRNSPVPVYVINPDQS